MICTNQAASSRRLDVNCPSRVAASSWHEGKSDCSSPRRAGRSDGTRGSHTFALFGYGRLKMWALSERTRAGQASRERLSRPADQACVGRKHAPRFPHRQGSPPVHLIGERRARRPSGRVESRGNSAPQKIAWRGDGSQRSSLRRRLSRRWMIEKTKEFYVHNPHSKEDDADA